MSTHNIELYSYRDSWDENDPLANFKAEVTNYTVADPMPTLQNLSAASGIPLPCLVRYVLVKWACSGAEAMLAISPIALQQMESHIQNAERVNTDEARLEAYDALRQMIAWFVAGETRRERKNT